MKDNILINEHTEIICKDTLYNFLINNHLNTIVRVNPPVSFNAEGKAISYFTDINWDFSYDKLKYKEKKCILNFDNYVNLNEQFMNEFKFLIITIYLANHENYVSSSKIKIISAGLYNIFNASQILGYKSICELNNELNFISVMESIKGKFSFRTLEGLLSLYKSANLINNPYFNLHFNIKYSSKDEKNKLSARNLALKYSKNESEHVNQTLYIPSKIHSKLISTCIDILSTKKVDIPIFMKYLEEEYLVYENLKSNVDLNKITNTPINNRVAYKRELETKRLLKKYNLSHFNSSLNVQKEVRLLATACTILILNFSGMRINEFCNIKTNGFSIINSEPKLYVLRTYETKISSGQVVDYITSPIVKDAFDILNIIHEVAKKHDKSLDKTDLVVSSKNQKLIGYGYISTIKTMISEFSKEINLLIDADDVKESELLNGPREKIKIGEVWPLASHQFRRTLVVNFVSHRLGTINAVKQQVKHMYATMTEYYAKNSQLASTFKLNVVKEIADNIQEELLNEGVRQYKQFYQSDKPLSGVKGKEIIKERKISKVLSDDEIKQLFKTGLYKITKSMYGYCTKGNLCDKKEAIDPTFCGASCSTMIITKENAENWQKLYFRNKKLLDSSNNLIVAGIPMNAAKTTMQSQNEVAKKIMNDFNMKYEG